jgi:outer membrane protein OmpA-like peptidoglycan-associated protein
MAVAARADECKIAPGEAKTWTSTIDGMEYEVRTATPAYDGDTGLFHLSSAYTLPKGKVSFSLFRDNLDRDPKDVDASIHGLNVAVGATSRVEVFGNVGIQNRVATRNLTQPGFVNDFPFAGTQATSPGWQTGFGDVKLGLKLNMLDDYRGQSVGLALKGAIKLPTADEKKGLGTGKTSGAVDLVLSKHLNHKADIHASLGYEINSDPDGLSVANAFKWGVGINLPSCRKLALQAEVTGKSYGSATFDQTNPVDLVVGAVFWIKPGIFIRPALSVNLNYNDRGGSYSLSDKAGRQISIGYHPGTPCCKIVAPAPPSPAPPPANRPPTVTLDCLKDSVYSGETTPCRASATDPDGDSLTYAWSTSTGKLTGSGPETTLDTTGVPCPTDIKVTVTVSDGRSGTASASDSVRVKCPEKKAETLCTSSGFPRNLSRLNNVDKACLDDVASRLRADPRARLVVIGYADSGERHPEIISRTRAEAIKAYLVKERGVDETRITARGAGATRLAETGPSVEARARNRRAEVILVPEGASAPED